MGLEKLLPLDLVEVPRVRNHSQYDINALVINNRLEACRMT